MRGNKRYRSGAWRLAVAAGTDPVTGRRRTIFETVRAPDNRAGAKQADARLAELIVEVEQGRYDAGAPRSGGTVTVAELADRWQDANRPRQDPRSGDWIGWSPKTAKTVADNFDRHLLPVIGTWRADQLTGVHLDDLYRSLEDERGLAPSAILRCHGQLRAMYNWGLRKKLVTANPALSADPPVVKARHLDVPEMADIRAVQQVASPAFALFIQLAATVGARRGTLVALRWGDIDLERGTITFSRSMAESREGTVEKGTKADRPYTVTVGKDTGASLAEHRDRAEEQATSIGVEIGARSFVFSDDGGVEPWSLGWPSHAWRRWSERAGVPLVRLHDLRHTAASQMLMAGVPISVVAERLGCTEGNILRTYRHFIPGADQGAADLMDRLLAGTPQ